MLALAGALIAAASLWILLRHRAGRMNDDLGTISSRWMTEFSERVEASGPR